MRIYQDRALLETFPKTGPCQEWIKWRKNGSPFPNATYKLSASTIEKRKVWCALHGLSYEVISQHTWQPWRWKYKTDIGSLMRSHPEVRA